MLFTVLFYISIVLSPAIANFARNTIFPCSTSRSISSVEEFRCENGTACINIEHMCDGIADCPDASDEVSCLPHNRRPKRQDSCIVPPHPANGIYEVANLPTAEAGQRFDSLVLSVRCRLGHGVLESSSQQVFCVNGRWFQSLPKCVRFCKLEPHPSVSFVCRGAAGIVECGQYVAPGTIVRPTCTSPIYYSPETLLNMHCVHGSWDYIARCKAECGRITPDAWALVIDGRTAKRGELPWHVGVYRTTTRTYKLICGGTLVSNNVVISAAHCFWSDVKKLLPATNFAVAIGKLYREWENDRDFDAQMSDLKEIKIPRLFQGQQANFQQDIAVLILKTPFTYKPHIRPVCLNFDKNFNRLQLQHGNLGKVAGWGIITANGDASPNLQVADIPYINEVTCIKTLPPSFREYITGDKFCAGYTNGTALCRGDSGGGLAFVDKELGIERFYLRGIVSTAPRSDDKLCNDHAYTAFTKITDHEDFIKESVQDSLKKICPHYLFQCADGACVDQGADCNGIRECADGSDEAEELCRPPGNTTNVPEDLQCILPPYPEHGTYFVLNAGDAQPNQTSSSWHLTVNCSQGYGLVNADGGIDENGTQINCFKGRWDRIMPKCESYCRLFSNVSVSYGCRSQGKKTLRDCDTKVASGFTVTPECNAPNYYSPVALTVMECISGFWNYTPKCIPECGRITPEGIPLVIGGRTAYRGELPWHVGVYSKTEKLYIQICGGTIISNNLVLSAAHCFWREVDHQLPAANYAVAAGKLYRDWDHHADVDAQKSDVKEIRMSSVFRGSATNFQGDIAVLTLATSFTYKTYVRPVCFNFDLKSEEMHLRDGMFGKIAGWGLTEANGVASDELQTVNLPFVDLEACHLNVPSSFTTFITLDKFCAGYANGTASLCRFDSGGGLVFPTVEQGVKRYYIRGISSTAPHNDDLCNVNALTTFTEISVHEGLIKRFF